MVEWISIDDKEQPPPKGEGVLISDGKHVTAAELMEFNLSGWQWWTGHCYGGYEWEWEDIDIKGITHWAELPKPPKKEA